MRSYYHQRATEYDDWWLGTGLFAARERPGWEAEVAELTRLIAGLPPARVLDVACGTGFLTQHLQGDVVAIDQSSAMVEVARARLPRADVFQADAVPLPFADREFDTVLTGHFYGHLIGDERDAFVSEVRRVADQLIVVDSARRPDTPDEQWQERKLNDGTRHAVYKRFFTARALADELGGGEILHDGEWFVVVGA